MRRILAPLVATSLLMLLPAAVLGAAAVPVQAGKQVTAGDCPKPKPQPPAPDATVEVNTTVPNVGDPLEISGIGYCPDEDVDLAVAYRSLMVSPVRGARDVAAQQRSQRAGGRKSPRPSGAARRRRSAP